MTVRAQRFKGSPLSAADRVYGLEHGRLHSLSGPRRAGQATAVSPRPPLTIFPRPLGAYTNRGAFVPSDSQESR